MSKSVPKSPTSKHRPSPRPSTPARRARASVAAPGVRRTVPSPRVVSADAPGLTIPQRTIARRHVDTHLAALGLSLKKPQMRTCIERELRRMALAAGLETRPTPISAPTPPPSLAALRDVGQDASGIAPSLLEGGNRPYGVPAPPVAPVTPYTDAQESVARIVERLTTTAHRLVTRLDPVLQSSPASASGLSAATNSSPTAFILAFFEGTRLQVAHVADLLDTVCDRLVL